MPKIVYFDLQGRAQCIRYLLTHNNVAFEDVRLGMEEWGPIKAAGTYGAGNSVPVFQEDDGTNRNQGLAILQMLCSRHGRAPQTPEELYEMIWYFETIVDHTKKELMPGLFTEGAP